ncbi:hypothetical protein [Fundidesulfovibrio magnetotacticus]|uniref:hypothetical protein n=1 Tax=Fundidesulfovibrio magnetotacticus TaxID=2730080 RepID=UPI0015668ED9|nr:hypothetical protein [Fundidesulfovibrio magnetotacticus]
MGKKEIRGLGFLPKPLFSLVRPAGFEPAAYGFLGLAPVLHNLLKRLEATEIVEEDFPHISRHFPSFAGFGG